MWHAVPASFLAGDSDLDIFIILKEAATTVQVHGNLSVWMDLPLLITPGHLLICNEWKVYSWEAYSRLLFCARLRNPLQFRKLLGFKSATKEPRSRFFVYHISCRHSFHMFEGKSFQLTRKTRLLCLWGCENVANIPPHFSCSAYFISIAHAPGHFPVHLLRPKKSVVKKSHFEDTRWYFGIITDERRYR